MLKRLTFGGCDKFGEYPLFFEYDSPDGILKDGQLGTGAVRYKEGSVYHGTLVYSGGRFCKYGFGEQNFLKSGISAADAGASGNLVLYKYVGRFDYTVTDWIYGDGAMYFLGANGKPAAFCTGFFIGLSRRGAHRGKFNFSTLPAGFTPDMRIKLVPHVKRFEEVASLLKGSGGADNILLGDSWFEFFGPRGERVLNIGVGGSTYGEWRGQGVKLLRGKKFKQVFINLGFNDLHDGFTPEKVLSSARAVIYSVLKINPAAKVFVNSVCPSVGCARYIEEEKKYNRLLKEFCGGLENVTFVNTAAAFYANGSLREDFASLFCGDKIHLTPKGYENWAKTFEKYYI